MHKCVMLCVLLLATLGACSSAGTKRPQQITTLPDRSQVAVVVSKQKDAIGPNYIAAMTWHCKRDFSAGKIAGDYPLACELVPAASGVIGGGGPLDNAVPVAIGGAAFAGGMALQRPDETDVSASGGSAGAGSTSIAGAKAEAGAGGGNVYSAPRPPRPPRWRH